MKRKISKTIFTILILINIFIPLSFGKEEDDEEELDYVWLTETIEKSKKEENLKILSKNACLYDRTSKTVIWGKDENKQVPMASTTKIMTAIILLENANLEETVEICRQAAYTGGSTVGMNTGDKITYRDLLYGLLLCSGNDAAVQIAVSIGGSLEGFAKLMNTKAKELGLKNTNFVTPHGLDAQGHYTTAYELAIMADYALGIEEFAQIVNTKTYTITINGYPRNISNTNELLRVFRRCKWSKNWFYKWSRQMFSNFC